MTQDEKLKALRKAWGYVEVSQATVKVSCWRVWLVKNYRGKPLSEMNGQGLPGNPKATRRVEYSGFSLNNVIGRAYHSIKRQEKG